ncbi:MAG: sigma-70 family RNA polymerase sigma factor [Ruminococcaceae bacterium]|nr:sigma-70 family RNA polymerase sigma factor [Oscillospiraceae bacterium]
MQNTDKTRDRLIDGFAEGYMEKLFYFCLKRTGNHTEAEDLTQDIALQIITALNKGCLPTDFSAWVWQIARNRYAVWAKRKRDHSESFSGSDIGDYEIEDESEDILDEMIHTEQMALLRRELAFIKSDYRNIVVAYYIENKSIRDIASSQSLSVSAVWQRLHRARIILKEGMDMARTFGKLSYQPEDIDFINNGLYGANGEPWNFISRSLCKNILLAAYRTPSTAEELAMEVGVALPYMEEELSALVEATLMKKNGNKYETNFFIVSTEAQKKIVAHLQEITTEITDAVIAAMEYEVSWKNANCPNWHEGYQPYEDMKWALLMYQTDIIVSDTLEMFNKTRPSLPKANLGSWGHTLRPNGGEWDLLGMERYQGVQPDFVGLCGCVTSPDEKPLPAVDFQQFKFQYRRIKDKTPAFLPYAYAQALVSIAKGEGDTVAEAMLSFLAQHGYIQKDGDTYKPTFLVMFKSRQKPMPPEALEALEHLRKEASKIAMRHYLFCREQIYKEIPEFLKDDEYQIDHACANMFDLRGAVLEEALRKGFISYAENDNRIMLGTFLRI